MLMESMSLSSRSHMSQRRARYFDRIIECPLPAAQRLEYPARLLAAAAAQFRYGHGSVQPLHNLTRVPLQQTLVGPRQSVLGQMADHFKQRRAHIVVEILGGEFLLSRPRESGANVSGKLVSGIGGIA